MYTDWQNIMMVNPLINCIYRGFLNVDPNVPLILHNFKAQMKI